VSMSMVACAQLAPGDTAVPRPSELLCSHLEALSAWNRPYERESAIEETRTRPRAEERVG
jgi:hypothetical protein